MPNHPFLHPDPAVAPASAGAVKAELIAAAEALADEVCEYARINTLGDGEKQHNVKRVRAAIAAMRRIAGGE